MTVAELIAELQTYQPDWNVKIRAIDEDGCGRCCSGTLGEFDLSHKSFTVRHLPPPTVIIRGF